MGPSRRPGHRHRDRDAVRAADRQPVGPSATTGSTGQRRATCSSVTPSSSASGTLEHRFLDRNREFVAEVGALEARVPARPPPRRRCRARLLRPSPAGRHRVVPALRPVVARCLDVLARPARSHRRRATRRRRSARSSSPTTPTRGAAGELDVPLSYRFAPGEPLDGVTLRVPLTALNQVDDATLDWQIPGYRGELVQALVRTLPKDIRRALIPLAETARAPRPAARSAARPARRRPRRRRHRGQWRRVSGDGLRHDGAPGSSADERARARRHGQGPRRRHRPGGDPRPPGHRRHARRSPPPCRSPSARGSRPGTSARCRRPSTPSVDGHRVVGYPALLDDDDSVSLRILTNADLQAAGDARRGAPAAAAHRRPVGRRCGAASRRGRPPGDRRQRDCRSPNSPPTAGSPRSTPCSTGADLPWDDAAFAAAAGRGAQPRRADRRGDAVGRRRACSPPPATCAGDSTGSLPNRFVRRSPTPVPTSTGWSGGTS